MAAGRGCTDKDTKAKALADVTRAVAATDPDRAERIAQAITDKDTKAKALAGVAVALAAADPDRAERIAQAIASEMTKVEVLVKMAEAWNLRPTNPRSISSVSCSSGDDVRTTAADSAATSPNPT